MPPETKSDGDRSKALTPEDFAAADEVLTKHAKVAPSHPRMREALASMHAGLGDDRFRLFYELRAPRTLREQIGLDLLRGRISEEEAKERFRAEAEREPDEAMVEVFYAEIERFLESYSVVRVKLAEAVAPSTPPEMVSDIESDIGIEIATWPRRSELFKEQLAKIYRLVPEVRVSRRWRTANLGQFHAESAAMLVVQILDYVTAMWESSSKIAKNSQTDKRYVHATNAVALFSRNCEPKLPNPNAILALVGEEHAAVRLACRKAASAPTSGPHSHRPPNASAATTDNAGRGGGKGKDGLSLASRTAQLQELMRWAHPIELVRATDAVLGAGELNPGVLSKACSKGEIETNGKKGRGSLVCVKSYLTWLGKQRNLEWQEHVQVRNAIIGEIIDRKLGAQLNE